MNTHENNPVKGTLANTIERIYRIIFWGGSMKPSVEIIQEKIGYTFRTPTLLTQALTRKSFAAENGGEDNEVLEFIGDKALDLSVIRIMVARFGFGEENGRSDGIGDAQKKSKAGFLTEAKSRLVQKKALSAAMDRLGFHAFLRMGAGDRLQNTQEQPSVKEDLFEAIIGAVTLDCGWNADTILGVVKKMLDFDAPSENPATINYKGLLQEWAQKNCGGKCPDYRIVDENPFVSEVQIPGYPAFRGAGVSHVKAEMAAAQKLYLYLQKNVRTEDPIRKAIGELCLENALSRLNELKQKGLIPKEEEVCSSIENPSGSPFWTCVLSIPGIEKTFTHTAASKNDARRECAYELLSALLEAHPEH